MDILGVIIFVIFLIVQGMTKNNLKKKKQEEKAAVTSQPKKRTVRPILKEDAWPANNQRHEAPEVFPDQESYQKAVLKNAQERSTQPRSSQQQNVPPRSAQGRNRQSQEQPEIGGKDRTILTQKDLKKAILWSEVLGSPRARKKQIR